VRSGHSEFYPEISDQMLVSVARDSEHLPIMRQIGFASAMIVPLVARGRTLGAITLVSAESGRRYEKADLELVEELARRGALAVDNARLYDEAQREIFERERAENRFRTLVEQIPAVTYIQSPYGAKPLEYVSPQIEDMLGYSPVTEAIDDVFLLGMIHPDDRERFLAEDRRTDETGEPFKVEYRQFTKNGQMVWVRDEAVLVRDEEGSPLYWLGVQYDITEQKRIEEALKESEELHRSVVEQAAENITSWNHAAARLYEYSVEEAVGQSVSMLYPPDRPDELSEILGKVRRGEKVEQLETVRVARDGRHLEVSLTVSPVRDPDDNIVGASTIARDIPERKRAEDALREAREAERNRIARDLQDDILQDIVYALQEIQIAQITSEGRPRALEEAGEALRRSVEGLRGAIFELRLRE
jgi:PAS domain S-box-containing protein